MPVAEIIAIGTELLLGEIQDTNTQYLARLLRDSGIDLYRATMIGDNPERIATALREAMQRADIIITTGGLGPTVDDPTRDAIALAVGVETEFKPELWAQIEERFEKWGRKPTDNNRRQAFIPQGAVGIHNPVGTAPAFRVEKDGCVIVSVPGVPREMEYLINNSVLPYLRERFKLNSTIQASVLHASGIGESMVDELVGDLEKMSNPTVGLAAHSGQIDIRITAKAGSVEEAQKMIAETEQVIRQRMGKHIYGKDEETLLQAVNTMLLNHKWDLCLGESGLDGAFAEMLKQAGVYTLESQDYPVPTDINRIFHRLQYVQTGKPNVVGLAVLLEKLENSHKLTISLLVPNGFFQTERGYGGPPENAPIWAINTTLDYMRRNLE